MKFLNEKEHVKNYNFLIMPYHIHITWKIDIGYTWMLMKNSHMICKIPLLLMLLTLNFVSLCQNSKYPLDSLTGIWVNENDGIKNYLIIDGFKKITISTSDVNEYFIRENPFGYFGLKDQNEMIPKKISELGKTGNTIISFEDSIKYYDSQGNLKRPLYNSLILFNEDLEDEKQLKTFSIVGISGRSEIYRKIDSIPDDVLIRLKNNPLSWRKYKRFIKMKEKIITSDKSYLYTFKHEKTNIYIIKGDSVEIIKEKGDWLFIKYYGNKIYRALIKTKDTE